MTPTLPTQPVPPAGRRSHLGPLLLFALFAAFFVLLPQGGDRPYHLSGIIETRNALREGQFPPRVTPHFSDGLRYPLLQFYGFFPYLAPALLTFLPGVNAYRAWEFVTFLSVTGAGFYTYRCTLLLTRQTWPAVVAGAVFVASPYLATDVRARFAYTEALSFCLLPPLLFYSLRAYVRPRWDAVVLGGVVWALVALSHNITYLYASALVALFFLSLFRGDVRKYVPRMLRVGACYGVGLVLVLWYVLPQLKVLKFIIIAANNDAQSPLWSTTWAPLWVLLSPVLSMSPTALGTPYLGVQVGWPILAAAVLAVGLVVASVSRRGPVRSGLRAPGAALLVRLWVALALAFFIVWSPVDFWRYVPRLFYNLQITYRILMFVVLWGSLLAGVSLAMLFRRRQGGMPPRAAWGCLLLVALAAMPYSVWDRDRLSRAALKQLVQHPEFGAGETVYRPDLDKLGAYRLPIPPGVPVVPADATAKSVRHGRFTTYRTTLATRSIVQLPVLFYPGLMEVRDSHGPVTAAGHLHGLVALDLPAGTHHVAVRFAGIRWANVASALGWIAVAAIGVAASWRRLANHRRQPRPASQPAAAPVFPARAAAFGFALLAVPLALPAGYVRFRNYLRPWAAGRVSASSEAAGELRALNAFDDDERTAWAAAGSNPASLTITPWKARMVSGFELLPRRTSLLEGWHEVGVILYLDGRKVGEQTFDLPDAARQSVQRLTLDRPATADRIELHFSRPVTETLDGGHVDPGVCSPGYSEIRIR